MKVYKILHKPTGLFFTPSRGSGNLSQRGKVYPRVPSLNYVGNGCRIIIKTWPGRRLSNKNKKLIEYFNIDKEKKSDSYWIDKHFEIPKEDWEIIEL